MKSFLKWHIRDTVGEKKWNNGRITHYKLHQWDGNDTVHVTEKLHSSHRASSIAIQHQPPIKHSL